ncbi:hypothetical protein HRbin16_03148 [bacterium HR16]|nr:hypothetical protein HRbin16_03148 [bacterium HR16]
MLMCVNRAQKPRHIAMPSRDHIPLAVRGGICPLHLIEQLPCHKMRGVSPSRHKIAILVAGELYGTWVCKKLLWRRKEAPIALVPGVFCPVRIGVRGVLSMMLQGELDEDTVSLGEVDNLLHAVDDA